MKSVKSLNKQKILGFGLYSKFIIEHVENGNRSVEKRSVGKFDKFCLITKSCIDIESYDC